MTRSPSLLTGISAAAAAALVLGFAPAAQARQAPVIVVPFAADSGDRCPMGLTKGVLGWHAGPIIIRPTVDVRGVVVDRPLPGETDAACREDRRFTSARFTALSRNVVVDSDIRRVDNGQVDFTFSLTSTTAIDMVVVQVCRHPLNPGVDICGPAQKYPAPRT